MTPVAQQLVQYRQHTALWIFEHIVIISSGMALVGLMLLLGGLLLWWNKQKSLDKKDELEIEKLELETKNMSQTQILAKGVEEITKESVDVDITSIEKTEQHLVAIQEYFRTEDIVINKLRKCYGSINVLPHKDIGGAKVDVLVRLSGGARAIFEIKRARTASVAKRQSNRAIEFLNHALKAYKDVYPERTVYGLGVILIDDKFSEKGGVPERKVTEVKPIDNNNKIMTMIFTENEFNALKCEYLEAYLTKLAFTF